jgi:signal transduction histidine kinase
MYFSAEPAPRYRLPLYKTILCATCALILIANAISLFQNLQSLKGANFQIGQTARVADRLQYVNLLVMDAESSLRGYFLSGSDIYLGPSKTAAAEVENEFNTLTALLSDSPSQLKNLAQLHTLVRRKISNMNQAVEVYKQAGLNEIVKIAQLSDERAVLDEIRLQVVIMTQEQNETLATRSAQFYSEYQKALILGVGINAIAIFVLIMFYRLVRSSLSKREEVEHALKVANESLESTVEIRTEQLSVLSRHLISVSEEEKIRLSRELHDEMGANLTAISMDLAAVTRHLLTSEPTLAAQLQRAKVALIEAINLKRRIIENLRPSLLDNLGLNAAIESYCEDFSRMSEVQCEVDIDPDIDGDIDNNESTLAIALFRIVQESLTNIMKYAKADTVTVTLKRDANGLVLRIIDDGIGIPKESEAKPMSHGLLGMRERALLLGGTFTVRRGRNDKGTCVEACIPRDLAAASSRAPHLAANADIPS